MTALALSQAAQVTGVGRITITRAIKSRWHAATRKEDGSYEIDTAEPKSSARRVRSLFPWRTAADVMADAELRHRVALAEAKLAELKTALDDMYLGTTAFILGAEIIKAGSALLSGPHALWPGRAETLIAAASRASVNALGHVATRDAQYHAAAVGKARSVRRRRMP
jgi:hypothetical protein